MISSIPSTKSKGRIRAIRGFNVRLQISKLKTSDRHTVIPILRVLGIAVKITPKDIQNQPPFPRKDINFIIISSGMQERLFRINSKIINSMFIVISRKLHLYRFQFSIFL